MKIRIISAHCIGNGRDVWPGEVLDLEERSALRKIRQGFAVEAGSDEPVTTELRAKPADVPAPAAASVQVPESGPEPGAPAAVEADPEAETSPSRGRGRSRG
jgi:hypothetical protein